MSNKTDRTMIQVSKATRERLSAFGAKGQTYDEIINQLLNAAIYIERKVEFKKVLGAWARGDMKDEGDEK